MRELPAGTVTFVFTDVEARRSSCDGWAMPRTPSSSRSTHAATSAVLALYKCRYDNAVPLFAWLDAPDVARAFAAGTG
jgi:hypothetical protein